MGMQLFIRRAGTVRGPFTSSEIRSLAASGGITPADEVSMDRTQWRPASKLSGIDWPSLAQPTPQPLQPAPAPPLSNAAAPFVLDEQDPAIVAKLLAHVRELCTSTETVKYIAVQRKPVVTLSPDAIVATSRRLIILHTGLLGKVEMRDFIWRDLSDARIREGMLATTFEVRLVNGSAVMVEYIPKRQARALYRICQEMEEQVREERRARSIEEARAAAGGVNVTLAAPAGLNSTPAPTPSADPMATLRQLKAMHEEGLLSVQEFEAKKAEVLARM